MSWSLTDIDAPTTLWLFVTDFGQSRTKFHKVVLRTSCINSNIIRILPEIHWCFPWFWQTIPEPKRKNHKNSPHISGNYPVIQDQDTSIVGECVLLSIDASVSIKTKSILAAQCSNSGSNTKILSLPIPRPIYWTESYASFTAIVDPKLQ